MSHSLKCYKKGDPMPAPIPGLIRLYSMRYCPYSQRLWLVLEHKRLPYEIVFVALREKCPDWIKERHPGGCVPILETEDKILYESFVCAQYLDDVTSKHRLTPNDPFEKARQAMLVAGWDKVSSAYHAVTVNFEEQGKWETMLTELERYESEIGTGNFFGGSEPSLLDFAIWPWFERFPAVALIKSDYEIDHKRFPRLTAYRKRMMEVQAVKACCIDPETHAKVIATVSSGNVDYGYGMD